MISLLKFKKYMSLFFVIVFCLLQLNSNVSLAAQKPQIDIYLIAGQSNAAGYSNINSINGFSDTETFNNVLYAGQVDKKLGEQTAQNDNLLTPATVKIGFGRNSSEIGPEYGMAQVLNPLYSSTTKALIFKTAAGGTSLRNIDTGNSGIYGNWCPPSKRLQTNSSTGKMYDLFINNFAKVYTEISKTYSPVIKGMAWMQGEDDRFNKAEYAELLTALINDIRQSLYNIVQDNDVFKMPFTVGEISPTFKTKNEYSTNTAFNEMLNNTVLTIENANVASSSDLYINDLSTDAQLGSDKYHFSATDMRILGSRFANKILSLSGYKVNIISAQNGAVTATTYSQTSPDLKIFATADNGYYLSSIKVNGIEQVGNLTDNYYLIQNAKGSYVVETIFLRRQQYFLTYTYNSSYGTVDFGKTAKSVYLGETVKIFVIPNEGYELNTIKAMGEELTFDSDEGCYLINSLSQDTEVVLRFKKVTDMDKQQKPQSNKTVLIIIITAAAVAVTSSLAIVLKRKFLNR